jgi:hypothetical protein
MGLLYGRAGRFTAKNSGFRPGQGLSKRNLSRLFAAVDTDGDGEVTCDEFIEEMLAFYNEHMKTVRRSARRHPPPHTRA